MEKESIRALKTSGEQTVSAYAIVSRLREKNRDTYKASSPEAPMPRGQDRSADQSYGD